MSIRGFNWVKHQTAGWKAKGRKRICFLSLFLLGTCYFLLPSTVKARPDPALSMFQNATLSPHFSPDPVTLKGISGGLIPITRIAGLQETANGPCVGFTDEQPDHRLVLTTFFNYLSLQVDSPDDTTILVRGPGGTWCNDDVQGKNPGIAGQWLPGTYEIWVGSFGKEKYSPYLIRITEVH